MYQQLVSLLCVKVYELGHQHLATVVSSQLHAVAPASVPSVIHIQWFLSSLLQWFRPQFHYVVPVPPFPPLATVIPVSAPVLQPPTSSTVCLSLSQNDLSNIATVVAGILQQPRPSFRNLCPPLLLPLGCKPHLHCQVTIEY